MRPGNKDSSLSLTSPISCARHGTLSLSNLVGKMIWQAWFLLKPCNCKNESHMKSLEAAYNYSTHVSEASPRSHILCHQSLFYLVGEWSHKIMMCTFLKNCWNSQFKVSLSWSRCMLVTQTTSPVPPCNRSFMVWYTMKQIPSLMTKCSWNVGLRWFLEKFDQASLSQNAYHLPRKPTQWTHTRWRQEGTVEALLLRVQTAFISKKINCNTAPLSI